MFGGFFWYLNLITRVTRSASSATDESITECPRNIRDYRNPFFFFFAFLPLSRKRMMGNAVTPLVRVDYISYIFLSAVLPIEPDIFSFCTNLCKPWSWWKLPVQQQLLKYSDRPV